MMWIAAEATLLVGNGRAQTAVSRALRTAISDLLLRNS